MLPLSALRLPPGLVGVLTDIDDTLTTEGAITPDALQALADLKAAGLRVIAITGRPVGWSEPFAQTWPLDAIVAENGAVALVPVTEEDSGPISPQRPYSGRRALSKIYQQDAATRAHHFARMQQVLAQIEREVPGARRATDSAGRETDIAIDHSEFTHLPQDAIDQVVRTMRAAGVPVVPGCDLVENVEQLRAEALLLPFLPHGINSLLAILCLNCCASLFNLCDFLRICCGVGVKVSHALLVFTINARCW